MLLFVIVVALNINELVSALKPVIFAGDEIERGVMRGQRGSQAKSRPLNQPNTKAEPHLLSHLSSRFTLTKRVLPPYTN